MRATIVYPLRCLCSGGYIKSIATDGLGITGGFQMQIGFVNKDSNNFAEVKSGKQRIQRLFITLFCHLPFSS